MDLIGIKGGQDSIVADGLAQKLERRGTMIHQGSQTNSMLGKTSFTLAIKCLETT